MGISEKIANAKKTNWLTKGLTDSEVIAIVASARAFVVAEKHCPETCAMSEKPVCGTSSNWWNPRTEL